MTSECICAMFYAEFLEVKKKVYSFPSGLHSRKMETSSYVELWQHWEQNFASLSPL